MSVSLQANQARAIYSQNIFYILVAKPTLEIAGHRHWVCDWVYLSVTLFNFIHDVFITSMTYHKFLIDSAFANQVIDLDSGILW